MNKTRTLGILNNLLLEIQGEGHFSDKTVWNLSNQISKGWIDK